MVAYRECDGMMRLETPAECRQWAREIIIRHNRAICSYVYDDEPLFPPGLKGMMLRTCWRFRQRGVRMDF